jgi:hypothetical protein
VLRGTSDGPLARSRDGIITLNVVSCRPANDERQPTLPRWAETQSGCDVIKTAIRNPIVTITIHFRSLLFAASQSLAVNLSGGTEREIHHIVCPRPLLASRPLPQQHAVSSIQS